MKKMSKAGLALLVLVWYSGIIFAQNATEIVKRADDKMRGESNYTEMDMTIVRPAWSRTISFKSWAKGTDYSLTLITAPAKEKGKTFLKREENMWSWSPAIQRLIKLPPSMMSQGWMGSDFSNDELLKESSLVNDYTHEIVGTEKLEDRDCYKIKLTARPDAAIVWGKQVIWVTKSDELILKREYYDDEEYLIKTEIASNIQKMDDRVIPTHFELIPADEEGFKTVLDMKKVEFSIDKPDNFFTQQNMKRVR